MKKIYELPLSESQSLESARYLSSGESGSGDRNIVVDEQPYYQSTEKNSDDIGTWLPFAMMIGMTGIGALLGTIRLPGIGTAIGVGAGAFVGLASAGAVYFKNYFTGEDKPDILKNSLDEDQVIIDDSMDRDLSEEKLLPNTHVAFYTQGVQIGQKEISRPEMLKVKIAFEDLSSEIKKAEQNVPVKVLQALNTISMRDDKIKNICQYMTENFIDKTKHSKTGNSTKFPFSIIRSSNKKFFAVYRDDEKLILGKGAEGKVKYVKDLKNNEIFACKIIEHGPHYAGKEETLLQKQKSLHASLTRVKKINESEILKTYLITNLGPLSLKEQLPSMNKDLRLLVCSSPVVEPALLSKVQNKGMASPS